LIRKYQFSISYYFVEVIKIMYGYGYGCGKCCKPVCGCYPKFLPSTNPPDIAGTWNLELRNLVRQEAGPDVSCADITDVTAGNTIPIVLNIVQCGSPNNLFITGTVASGPTGASPILTGDQLLGVFCKDPKGCWTLKLVSPNDNTTFELTFKGYGHSPRCLNFCYSKPLEGPGGFSAVGAGSGTKQ